MRKNRNIFESLTICLLATSVTFFLINQLCNYSPINYSWFALYVATLFFTGVCFCFRFLKGLLSDTTPISYNLQNYFEKYPSLKVAQNILPKINLYPRIPDAEHLNRKDIEVITNFMEKKLVTSWFSSYISTDNEFPDSCKELIGDVFQKCIEISSSVNTTNFYNNTLTILLRHLIEYQEATQKLDRNPKLLLPEIYKTSHPISAKIKTKLDEVYCQKIVKTFLKEVLSTEYYDSPQCLLLQSLITKKLYTILEEISEPQLLYKSLNDILSKTKCQEISTANNDEMDTEMPTEIIAISKSNEVNKFDTIETPPKAAETNTPDNTPVNVVETALSELLVKTTAPILQNVIGESPQHRLNASAPVQIGFSPVKRRIKNSEVKIHSKFAGLETWENDMDLANASLGQDLLDNLNGQLRLSGLWELDNFEVIGDGLSPNPAIGSKSPLRLWFGEEDILDSPNVPERSPPHINQRQNNVRTDPSSILSNNFSLATLQKDIKELQNTVTQAKNRIGDIQDEAAGMIEGILDLGFAGLKKGLNIAKSQDTQSQTRPEKDTATEVTTWPLRQKETKAEESEMALRASRIAMLKEQPHVASEDLEVDKGGLDISGPAKAPTPQPVEEASVDFLKQDSPEPEYEDPADFATAIARLRTLLQEKASDQSSNDSNDGWWDGVAETRGRESSNPRGENVDHATLADLPANPSMMPLQPNNNMQRLDRLLQRTVTGVFNSLKSAVGAEVGGEGTDGHNGGSTAPQTDPDALQWRYVKGTLDMTAVLSRFVARRRGVESAEDSLRALTPIHPCASEEFESWRVVIELLAALTRCSHVFARAASRILPEPLEPLINAWYTAITVTAKSEIIKRLKTLAQSKANNEEVQENARNESVNLDDLCAKIIDLLPATLRFVADDVINDSIFHLLSSFKDKQINKDVIYQILDLATLHFVRAARCRSANI